MVNFLAFTIGLSVGLIGLIIAVEMLAGIYPSMITGLTTLNNTSGIKLRTLIAPDGIIPLVVVAVFIIAIIVGLFSLIKQR